MVRRNLGRIGTFKHIHHSDPHFSVDTKGKDTWLHAEAGASVVVSLAQRELAVIRKDSDIEQLGLDQILPIFRREKVDYVFAEGLYREFARRRGVVKILCVSKEEEALELMEKHGRAGIVCITGKIARYNVGAKKNRNRNIQGIPILRIPDDVDEILRLVVKNGEGEKAQSSSFSNDGIR
jgi:molybdopterin-guanine dinucleotide biosynthesis protein MobB